MATLNPVPLVRDVSNDPEHWQGVHVIAGRLTSDGSIRTILIETRLKSIIFAAVMKENSTTSLAVITIGDSSTYAGTKTVSFPTVASGVHSYLIAGLLHQAATMDTYSANTTITYNPITGTSSSAST